MIRKILSVQDPILHKESAPVKRGERKLEKLIRLLEETLLAQKDPEGVGLSAVQIGVLKRVFIISIGGKTRHFVNAKITKFSKKTNDPIKTSHLRQVRPAKLKKKENIMEGCLSLPNFYGPVRRALKINIKYQKLNIKNGTPFLKSVEKKFSGFIAQAIQHEVDHLNGITFVERLLEQNRSLYKMEGKEWVEVELI